MITSMFRKSGFETLDGIGTGVRAGESALVGGKVLVGNVGGFEDWQESRCIVAWRRAGWDCCVIGHRVWRVLVAAKCWMLWVTVLHGVFFIYRMTAR